MVEYTTHADGIIHKCERIYYSIQLWVIEVAEKGGSLGLESFRGPVTMKITIPSVYGYQSFATAKV